VVDQAARLERHRELEAELQGMSQDELVALLGTHRLPPQGAGPIRSPRSGGQVFAKLVPLTALELEPEHQRSTANLFRLPSCYQHRLGSCGFGAWRELEAHRIANQWVLSGSCPQFALLHGWRVVPLASSVLDDKRSLEAWGNAPAIHRRVAAIEAATHSVALFLEWFPQNLSQWLSERLADEADPSAMVRETEAALLELTAFMNGQGMLHMDAHFENVLTDGTQLFLTDYGLATSRTFELDPGEQALFDQHTDFDRCTAINSNVHAIVSRYDPRVDWRQGLRELMAGTHCAIEEVPVGVRSYLARRGPLALAVGEFYRRLGADLSTEYPAAEMREILDTGFAP
jgi:hypothetical protein